MFGAGKIHLSPPVAKAVGGSVVVDSVFNVSPLLVRVLCLVFVLFCIT